jgi:hypothetical protein
VMAQDIEFSMHMDSNVNEAARDFWEMAKRLELENGVIILPSAAEVVILEPSEKVNSESK